METKTSYILQLATVIQQNILKENISKAKETVCIQMTKDLSAGVTNRSIVTEQAKKLSPRVTSFLRLLNVYQRLNTAYLHLSFKPLLSSSDKHDTLFSCLPELG